jgi:hypothetical protein
MAGHRWMGYLVWAVLFGALFVWEGVGLVRTNDALPTLSDAMRAVMRYPVGRWALFALWLWLGWHAFIRGWHFLLRGPEGGGVPVDRGGPMGTGPSLIRQDLLPMLVGYLLVMGMLAVGLRTLSRTAAGPGQAGRRPGPGLHSAARQGWGGLIRRVAGTAVGGYLLLMAVVVVYYYGVARRSGHFLASASTGAALLIGLAVPMFFAASWLVERRRICGRNAAGNQRAQSKRR